MNAPRRMSGFRRRLVVGIAIACARSLIPASVLSVGATFFLVSFW